MAMIDRLSMKYFGAAIEYYVLGRFAVVSHLGPIAGVQLHHAVEMALKGYLVRSVPSEDLKGTDGHSLPKLWRRFKETSGDPDVAEFDVIVQRLDQFETLRYPEHAIEHGAETMIAQGPVPDQPGRHPDHVTPRYMLSLEDIDRLLERLFSIASVNPGVYTSRLWGDAKKFLNAGNGTSFAG